MKTVHAVQPLKGLNYLLGFLLQIHYYVFLLCRQVTLFSFLPEKAEVVDIVRPVDAKVSVKCAVCDSYAHLNLCRSFFLKS